MVTLNIKNLRNVTQKHYFQKSNIKAFFSKKENKKINILKIYEKQNFHLNYYHQKKFRKFYIPVLVLFDFVLAVQ